jgi:hypothetical protein
MNSAIATSAQALRRRNATATPSMAIDAPYRHAVSRRRGPAPGSEDYGWPQWFMPSALVTVMAAITLYHHQALLSALRLGW